MKMVSVAQYQRIRDRLSQKDRITNNIIHQLKSHFQNEINSRRVFERIISLSHLITVLEKRDVIGCDQVANLRYIMEIIDPNDNFIYNILDNRIEQQSRNFNLPENRLQRHERVLSPIPPDPIEKIHRLLRSEMGTKWKELARALEISEGDIDTLDHHYRGYIPDMVNELLRLHQENCVGNYELWRSKLQEALVRARRTDLSVRINDILTSMHLPNAVH